MADVMVSFENLEKRFPGGDRPALSGITARIRSGVITGLVGPDGAGKTTLMRLLAGLLDPTSGKLVTATRDLIGYMPQKFGLYEDLSVQENLDLHADLRGVVGEERRTIFQRLLEFTDLGRFTSRFAGRLSGGMKQKLGLACALLGRPRLLLLDEPSVGVDPISRRELWRMVNELAGQGLTIVWSTAYLDEAELCREVLLLNEGRLLFAGEPASLTARVKDRCFQIRNIAGSRREVLARALRSPAVLDGIIQGANVRLVLRPGRDRAELEAAAGGSHAGVAPVPPRFEDAFVDVLGGGPGADSALARQVQSRSRDHETVVEAVGLTKRFGSFVAADNVTFSVKQGEVFGLLGPNGAGKSTTFRMMCGLLTPSAGTAHVMGIDLRKSPSRARQRLGYMAQKFSLYGNLTVRQNLDFFSGAYGLRNSHRKEMVEAMINVFHLARFADSSAGALPLGFKQRLALAAAMIHSPDIVFLDEPTSGVDPVSRREFWNHINGIVEKGVTVVVTTHFMEEAEYCDRIALVFRGRIIAAGTPDTLKAQAASEQNPEPSMEDAFIHLVQGAKQEAA
ncbi:MAG TPA: ATP-binding cassette domain-containing protein [Verrucomicrobiae bacterium]